MGDEHEQHYVYRGYGRRDGRDDLLQMTCGCGVPVVGGLEMSQFYYQTIPISRPAGTAQTVGATTVDLITLSVPTGQRWALVGSAIGSEPTPTSAILSVQQGAFNNGGTVSLVGSLATLFSGIDVALTGASLTFVASSGNVILRATGVLAKTITWFGQIELKITL